MNRVLMNCIAKGENANQSNAMTNEVTFNQNEVKKVNKNELKNIAQHFNSKYRDILNVIKKDVFSNIKDQENAKMTYTKFLQELLNKYSNFIDLLRFSKNEDLITPIVSLQKLMIEVNNIIRGL